MHGRAALVLAGEAAQTTGRAPCGALPVPIVIGLSRFYGKTEMIACNCASVRPWSIPAALIPAVVLADMGLLGAASGPWHPWQLLA